MPDELWDFLNDTDPEVKLLLAGWWPEHNRATGRREWCHPDSTDRYGTTEDAIAALDAKGGADRG